eukprot:scaffold185291_cov17-Prasinocladus_malaysianus.AAC.1
MPPPRHLGAARGMSCRRRRAMSVHTSVHHQSLSRVRQTAIHHAGMNGEFICLVSAIAMEPRLTSTVLFCHSTSSRTLVGA